MVSASIQQEFLKRTEQHNEYELNCNQFTEKLANIKGHNDELRNRLTTTENNFVKRSNELQVKLEILKADKMNKEIGHQNDLRTFENQRKIYEDNHKMKLNEMREHQKSLTEDINNKMKLVEDSFIKDEEYLKNKCDARQETLNDLKLKRDELLLKKSQLTNEYASMRPGILKTEKKIESEPVKQVSFQQALKWESSESSADNLPTTSQIQMI